MVRLQDAASTAELQDKNGRDQKRNHTTRLVSAERRLARHKGTWRHLKTIRKNKTKHGFKHFKLLKVQLPHQLPLSAPLEEPLDGGLRGPGLTLQEGAAALHAKLHRFSQALLHCAQTQTAGDATAQRKRKRAHARARKTAHLWR